MWGPSRPGENEAAAEKRKAQIRLFITHMCLSNTVKPYWQDNELKFQSESAEELAMCVWTRSVGFTKLQVDPVIMEVTSFDESLSEKSRSTTQVTYAHVATFGFTPKRARVTVIYQEQVSKKILIMCKGQDTTVLDLLQKMPNRDQLSKELNDLCANGLRTLVCGHATQDAKWWADRQGAYQKVITKDETNLASGHPARCSPGCEKCEMDKLFEKYEKDAGLEYVGAMGLEDQLQSLVPESIKDYLSCGIRVWMITGDKLETAKNIGLACNLIDPDMSPQLDNDHSMQDTASAFRNSRLIEVTGQWADICAKEDELSSLFDMFDQNRKGALDVTSLEFFLKAMKYNVDTPTLQASLSYLSKKGGGADAGKVQKGEFVKMLSASKPTPYEAVSHDIDEGIRSYGRIRDHETYPVSIMVTKEAFMTMFPGARPEGVQPKPGEPSDEQLEELRHKFFLLASVSKSVVFARAQPAMKKKMVTEIMARVPGVTTLAIGDGANDTDMIKAAHIGIGIAGVEGTAAVNSADYAIGTFRFLHTLLFKHGMWSYQRTSALVYFIFYKAMMLAITAYCFGIQTGMNGQQFVNDLIMQPYNIMLTAFPIIFLAVLDQPLPADVLENNPMVYSYAKHSAFTHAGFLGWCLRSILHSVWIYLVPCLAFDGTPAGLWYFSTAVYAANCCLPNIMFLFLTNTMNLIHFSFVFLSFFLTLAVFTMANGMLELNPDILGVVDAMLSGHVGSMYCKQVILFAVLVPCIIEFGIVAFYYDSPSFLQIMREQEKLRWRKFSERDSSIADAYANTNPVTPSVTGQKTNKNTGSRLLNGGNSSRDGETDKDLVDYGFKIPGVHERAYDPRYLKSKPDAFTEGAAKLLDTLYAELTETDKKNTALPEAQRLNSFTHKLISGMLRFRHLTGSHFDGATFQKSKHDKMKVEESGGDVPAAKAPPKRGTTMRKKKVVVSSSDEDD